MTTQLSLLDVPKRLRSFDDLAGAVMARTQGLSLKAISTLDALSRELESGHPDPDRVREFAHRLGIDPIDLELGQ